MLARERTEKRKKKEFDVILCGDRGTLVDSREQGKGERKGFCFFTL